MICNDGRMAAVTIRSQTMSNKTAPVHADNLLGICHAMGDAFGVNPLIFRLTLIVGLLLSPPLTIAAYVTAGLAVVIAHLCTRDWRRPSRRPRALS
jgi:phage shock protein PspC (stress-responsive transcriptional regulator)